MKLKFAIIMICLTLAASCGGGGKKVEAPKELSATKVLRGTIEKPVLFTGNIVAQDYADVFPRAPGKVTKKLLKEGDPVKRGQGILVVDRDEIGFKFKPLIVDSPIDGFVGAINVDVGEYLYDRTVFSQKPAAVVVRPGPMRVKLDIPERYLGVIVPGTDVTMSVDSLNGDTYQGKIITSSPVVDEKTRTANVEVEVQNTDGRLRHGMFGRMRLVVEKKEDALIAPINAISWEGEKRFVYKIAEGKAHRAEVKTGMRNDVHVELTEGAAEGDELALGNLLDIRDGEAVTVKPGTGNQEPGKMGPVSESRVPHPASRIL